jgi:hypothetical protein
VLRGRRVMLTSTLRRKQVRIPSLDVAEVHEPRRRGR